MSYKISILSLAVLIFISCSEGIKGKRRPIAGKVEATDFDCPEEFGYYPHNTDCTKYYVCVFGGALLESCTGGLMYSHELQTCDWPRNVDCSARPDTFSTLQVTDPRTTARKSTISIQINPKSKTSQFSSTEATVLTHNLDNLRIPQFDQNDFLSSDFSLGESDQDSLGNEFTLVSKNQEPRASRFFVDNNQHVVNQQLLQEASSVSEQPERAQLKSHQQTIIEEEKDFHINRQTAPLHNQQGSAFSGASQLNQALNNNLGFSRGPTDTSRTSHSLRHPSDFQADINHLVLQTQTPNSLSFEPVFTPSTLPPINASTSIPEEDFYPYYEEERIPYDEYMYTDTPDYGSVTSGRGNSFYKPSNIEAYHSSLSSGSQNSFGKPAHNFQTFDKNHISSGNPNSIRFSLPVTTPGTFTIATESPSLFQSIPSYPTTQRITTTPRTTPFTTTTTSPSPRPFARITTASFAATPSPTVGSIFDFEEETTPDSERKRNNSRKQLQNTAGSTRPTLKPATSIVSTQAPLDIFESVPKRPNPVLPQPAPMEAATKCKSDTCKLPDCSCGGKDIPGGLKPENTPQVVLLTFDDAVNDLNRELYQEFFERGRKNPNGCPIQATFYVSHEWTDYSQVQNLYSDGHEIASHSISHSFGEQFSSKKWMLEVDGQRDIIASFGGVPREDIRGMRAPFLAIGGNRMFEMLYETNFTYDSSMPVYENRPPSWPYTLDYKIFHDCMIPPCPTNSFPGLWEVPMVMWQDLNGGRCSMGDGCSSPSNAEGVYKMLIKNFERHYTTNRAPFGLFYHAAWFTQPHHKEGFLAFLDTIVNMDDVWLVTNWQLIQWIRDPTPLSQIKNFTPYKCNYPDRPKKCKHPKVCNLWHKSGVRYMRTCQKCPEHYPWVGKTGVKGAKNNKNKLFER